MNQGTHLCFCTFVALFPHEIQRRFTHIHPKVDSRGRIYPAKIKYAPTQYNDA